MKFNVNTSIDIQFTEDQIKELLTETVKQSMPQVEVQEINWIIKRNPVSVSAKVEASMKGFNTTSTEATTLLEETPEEVEQVETQDQESSETEAPKTVADLLEL